VIMSGEGEGWYWKRHNGSLEIEGDHDRATADMIAADETDTPEERQALGDKLYAEWQRLDQWQREKLENS
jgi:hypothetical protein